ncbi:UNVERIFIED_CONTAM: hypothetical protein K2H54_064267 [Gekko kuhli]
MRANSDWPHRHQSPQSSPALQASGPISAPHRFPRGPCRAWVEAGGNRGAGLAGGCSGRSAVLAAAAGTKVLGRATEAVLAWAAAMVQSLTWPSTIKFYFIGLLWFM